MVRYQYFQHLTLETTDIIYHSLQSEPESECDPADLCTTDPDFYRGGTESGEEIIK